MNKLLAISTVLGALFFAPALQAADMQAPQGTDWSGFYLGGNLGYGHESWSIPYYDNQIPIGGEKTVSGDGLIGGVQAGYNWQLDNVILGIEADYQAANLNSDEEGGFNFDNCGCFNVSMNSFGTLRGRAGFAITDGFMIYGTGGLIVGDLNYSAADSSPVGSDNSFKVGWTAGLGAEAMVTQQVSVKLEYLHYDFGNPHFDLGNTNFNTNMKVSGEIGRVGINFHF